MTKNQPFTKEQKRTLFLSSLGGVLEFYDFIIYIFLAPYIEKIFFSHNTAYIATLKTLAIFSVGYLVRPLGGIIFSHYGDRYGRKVIFLLTVIFMAIPSFAIGLLPSPEKIGIAAPILLLIFRLMQGLALGGEIPAAITFVAEHVPYSRRGFALATLFFGINMGLLLGSLITTLLTSLLPEISILEYGWRIPFILGGCFGIISIFLRGYLRETAAFKALHQQEILKLPCMAVIRNHFANVIQGILLVSLGSVTVFFYLYWPQYLHQYMHYDFATLMRLNTGSTLILNFMILLGGLLADKVGFRISYLISSIALMALSYPLYMLFTYGNMGLVVLSYIIFSIFFGFIPSAYSAIISMLFPTQVRYSGIALSYNIAYAFFGGLSPIICTLLINQFDSVIAPAYYCMMVAALAGYACYRGSKVPKLGPNPQEQLKANI